MSEVVQVEELAIAIRALNLMADAQAWLPADFRAEARRALGAIAYHATKRAEPAPKEGEPA